MCRELIHIYGPLSIQSYGLAGLLGILVVCLLAQKNPRYQRVATVNIFDLIGVGILGVLMGGRLMYVMMEFNSLTSWLDVFAIWNGGLSVLGGTIGLLAAVPLYLWYKKANILGYLDLVGIYGALLQAIARLGCLCAGCCYGIPTTLPWAISFRDPNGFAPVGITLHPTQVYSIIFLTIIFLIMFGWAQYKLLKPGQLISVYIFLASIERFVVDIWRGDRPIVYSNAWFSLSSYQLIALCLILVSIIGFIVASKRTAVPTQAS